MSYTPTNWQTGDTVTAEKLNKMEQGIELANDPFVVTLTPTAPDFSGTMDKTIEEINNAYEAGRKIVFRVLTSATDYMEVDCSARWAVNSEYLYPSFNAFIFNDQNSAFIYAGTGVTDDGTRNDYFTQIYPLTPMS